MRNGWKSNSGCLALASVHFFFPHILSYTFVYMGQFCMTGYGNFASLFLLLHHIYNDLWMKPLNAWLAKYISISNRINTYGFLKLPFEYINKYLCIAKLSDTIHWNRKWNSLDALLNRNNVNETKSHSHSYVLKAKPLSPGMNHAIFTEWLSPPSLINSEKGLVGGFCCCITHFLLTNKVTEPIWGCSESSLQINTNYFARGLGYSL